MFNSLKSTNLFSELDVEVLDDDNVWGFDMRETNFWMVLRDGALILELRLLWYFWNKLSTWHWKKTVIIIFVPKLCIWRVLAVELFILCLQVFHKADLRASKTRTYQNYHHFYLVLMKEFQQATIKISWQFYFKVFILKNHLKIL